MKTKIAIAILLASVIYDNDFSNIYGTVNRVGSSMNIYNPSTGSNIHVNQPVSKPNYPMSGIDTSTGRYAEVHRDSYGNVYVRQFGN